MEEKETGAFIVLSDTHLGLREFKRLHFFKNTVAHRPIHVDQFVKWLEKLQSEGEIDLPVATEELHDDGEYEIKMISSRKLSSPDTLVLNGDIFELWDASDQSILFSSNSILNSISRLSCEKIYLIGNHDFANAQLATGEEKKMTVSSNLYPWGLSDLNIFRNTYPTLEDGKIRTLRMGDDHYLFIHGHQFFSSVPWEIISFIRDGAEAFRLYSWVLVGLWIIWIGTLALTAYLEPEISPSIQYGTGFPLTILAFPRIFVSIARPIWNKFFGSRYDRKKAPRAFIKWWKKFTKNNELEEKRIHIIYGHTHAIDIVGKSELEKMVNKNIEKIDVTLINHPAWVKDSKSKHKSELQEVFVYVDKFGFEFFGWNWDINSPFHIPKSVVRTYVSGRKIDDDIADLLNTLHWPKKLIEELKASGSKSKRVGT
jgi:UDP-2,3-diacylglucosamine pyrophosphatase LpxH